MKTWFPTLLLLVICGSAHGKSIDSCAFNKNPLWDGLVTYQGPLNKMDRIRDVMAQDMDGAKNQLSAAVWFGYDDIVRGLLENHRIRDKYGAQALGLAVSMGRLTETSMLLDAGVPANAKVSYGSGEYVTPIFFAAQYGCVDAMHLLVEHGAKVNYRATSRLTALELAVLRGHLRAARFLLTHGYKVSEREKDHINKILANMGMVPQLRPTFWQVGRQRP